MNNNKKNIQKNKMFFFVELWDTKKLDIIRVRGLS